VTDWSKWRPFTDPHKEEYLHAPDLDYEALERLLYSVIIHPVVRIAESDWSSLHNEFTNRKNLPLMLQWQD